MTKLLVLFFGALSILDSHAGIGVSAQVATLDPRQFSGLVAYYHGSYLGSLSDNAAITTWPDCSGNRNDLTQTTNTYQPKKITDYLGASAARFEYSHSSHFNIPSSVSISSSAFSCYGRMLGFGIGNTWKTTACVWDLGTNSKAVFYYGQLPPFKAFLYDGGLSHAGPALVASHLSYQVISAIGGASTSSMTQGNITSSFGTALNNNTLTGGKIGYSTLGFQMQGDYTDIAIFNRALSATEDAAVRKCLAPMPFYYNVIFDGDSLTFGYTLANPTTPLIETSYPWQACRLVPGIKGWNLGLAGATIPQMPVIAISAYVDTNNFAKNLVVAWGGTNDIVTDGVDNSTVLSRLQSYVTLRHSEGWKVIILSMLVRSQFNGTQEGYRVAFNSSLRSDHSWADGFADVANDARLQNSSNTTYFESDGIHLTKVGYGVVASIVAPIIVSL